MQIVMEFIRIFFRSLFEYIIITTNFPKSQNCNTSCIEIKGERKKLSVT